MAKKVRKTQEEEIIEVLKKEGFRELDQKEVKKQPYRTIHDRTLFDRKPG